MNKKIAAATLILIGLIVGLFLGWPEKIQKWLGSTDFGSRVISYTSEENFPAPLRGLLDSSAKSYLTKQGVIDETNKQRANNGNTPLHENARLDKAAEAKVDDMFAQQYFEHKSPDGKMPADLAHAQGYDFVVVGENLALGNFENDKALVEAWMNSPGHRANILHSSYQEIGVAVKKGQFEGKTVWLAVQEFGTPLSNCPGADLSLKAQIDTNRANIAALQSSLSQEKADLNSNRYSNREEYNAAVAVYNNNVNKVNALINETQKLVTQYNSSVNQFNSCLETNS